MSRATAKRTDVAAAQKARVQGVATEQTVKSSAGVLHRIVLSNGGATARTLTVTDGSTVQNVMNIAPSDSRSCEFGVKVSTSIKVTPSHADVDALVIYD